MHARMIDLKNRGRSSFSAIHEFPLSLSLWGEKSNYYNQFTLVVFIKKLVLLKI